MSQGQLDKAMDFDEYSKILESAKDFNYLVDELEQSLQRKGKNRMCSTRQRFSAE